MLPSGKTPVIQSRTGWALAYMKQAGLVSLQADGCRTSFRGRALSNGAL